MTKDELIAIADRHPHLTSQGFSSRPDRDKTEQLRASIYACNRACDFLQRVEKTTEVSYRYSSADLRKLIEARDLQTCSIGAIIAAAIHLKLKYKQSGANAFFNLSSEAIEALAA